MADVFTARDKADCAEREVKQRQRVYPRLVSEGRMTQQLADRQTALMVAIAADYRLAADIEDAKGRLL
ncbi:hypothetical protein L2449_28850 [Mesorhizobium muleiense]|uniref:hypothetical protein n=1 Tax=Mesorhizobium muleiense TaxID=1004279 RepID=UPI001F22C6C4|nr:hypothetical protein [Mesorhizobium muleiense]MCF6120837.1 hypothetical protein [Mesorhizobium muleiense]